MAKRRAKERRRTLLQLKKFGQSLLWPVTRWKTVAEVIADPDVGPDYGRGVGVLFALLIAFWLCVLVTVGLVIDRLPFWSAFITPAVLIYFSGTFVSYETSQYES